MIKAKHLLNPTNKLTVVVKYEEGGEIVEGSLTVHHRILTPELWGQITEKSKTKKADAKEAKDSLVSELLALLVSWDVEGEDGKPLPITEENLRRMDYKILKEINVAIFAYTFPNVTT
jgi:hypothetical protein